MADATQKFASKANLKALAEAAKAAYEPKDDTIVKDPSYTHTDSNYTADEKAKLSEVAPGAQVNVVETVKVNGAAQAVEGKAVDITVPTKTSDLANDDNVVKDADYATMKTKVAGIAEGAQANVIEGVTVGGEDAAVTSKKVALGSAAGATAAASVANDATLPTGAAVTSFVEGKGYQTSAQVASAIEGYGYQTAAQVSSAVGAAVAGLYHFRGSVQSVGELPSDAAEGDVYNVVGEGGMNYACKADHTWDALGADVDLSDYARTADFGALTESDMAEVLAEL